MEGLSPLFLRASLAGVEKGKVWNGVPTGGGACGPGSRKFALVEVAFWKFNAALIVCCSALLLGF